MPVAQILVGFDGSAASIDAIDVGALLLPRSDAWIAHLWTPPFASERLRRRLWTGSGNLNQFIESIEREGEWEATRVAAVGVTLARAAGWNAVPLVRRTLGGEGLELTQLAADLEPDLLAVGSRGLGGARAVLGSVSDMVVHYAQRPVLVTPHPLLTTEHADLADGPVVIGWDGSAGAQAAFAAAERMFPDRELLPAHVDGPDPTDVPAETGDRKVIQLRVGSRHEGSTRAVADALAACAHHHRAALVVVGSRGRSAVRELLLGSVAMMTLHHAHRPVMVVPRLSDSEHP